MRVYKYWVEPITAADNHLLDSQIKLARDYKRSLIDVENAFRDALKALDLTDAVIAQYDTALTAQFALPPDQRDEAMIATAKALLKAARKHWHEQPAYKEARTVLVTAQRANQRAARTVASAAGLYWGTYLLVEESLDQAARTTDIWQPISRHVGDWNAIGVHVQGKPLTAEAVFAGADRRLRIGADFYALARHQQGYRAREVKGPTGARQPPHNVVNGPRPERLRELNFRVGSAEDGRSPRWAHFHLLMSNKVASQSRVARAIPPQGVIKLARIHRERIGIRYRYNVQFVVDDGPLTAPAPVTATSRITGVDIGWRRVPTGIRIAFAKGSDWESELIIPDRLIDRRLKVRDLASIRDNHMNTMRTRLLAWREQLPADHPFTVATGYLHAWRRMGHFVTLHHAWATMRTADHYVVTADDTAVFDAMATWIHNDRHLCDWQFFTQRHLKNAVDTLQWQWAAMVAKRSDVIGLEDAIGLAKRMPRTAEDHHTATAHLEVRPGALPAKLTHSATTRGVHVVRVPAAGTTTECALCHGTMAGDRAELILRCTACNTAEDQDRNAAAVIRQRARASVRADLGEALAPVKSVGKGPRGPRRTRKGVNQVAPLATLAASTSDIK